MTVLFRYSATEGGTLMRSAKIILCILSILGGCAQAQRVFAQPSGRAPGASKRFVNWHNKRFVPTQKRIVIAASTLLDGKGHVLHDTRIVIEGAKILRIDPKAAPIDYDLRGLTVLPGWI